MGPDISVVIPTYNRVRLLKKCLKSLLNQSLDKARFEIIVVDDGSSDETIDMLMKLINKTAHALRAYRQDHKLSGCARNLGIKAAFGDIILSMDDDIEANSNLLKQHLEVHYKFPELETAIVGKVITGKSGIDIMNPDNRKISSIGVTTDGDLLVDVNYFTTQNVSFKREFVIKAGLFTPGLPRMDDMDLAFRLKYRGLNLIYLHNATCIHMKPLNTIEKVVDSGKRYGQTLAYYYHRIPHFQGEIANLGARFNGGWDHFIHYPWNYIKDTGRRF